MLLASYWKSWKTSGACVWEKKKISLVIGFLSSQTGSGIGETSRTTFYAFELVGSHRNDVIMRNDPLITTLSVPNTREGIPHSIEPVL